MTSELQPQPQQNLSSNKQNLEECSDSSLSSIDSQIGYFEITEYPKTKIITCFLIFGGALGGLIIWLPLGLSNSYYMLDILITAVLGGAIGGIIPSFIVALKLVYDERKLRQASDWGYLFVLGAIVSFLYAILIIFGIAIVSKGDVFRGMNGFNEFLLIITLSVTAVGGLSSLILGSIVLPKH